MNICLLRQQQPKQVNVGICDTVILKASRWPESVHDSRQTFSNIDLLAPFLEPCQRFTCLFLFCRSTCAALLSQPFSSASLRLTRPHRHNSILNTIGRQRQYQPDDFELYDTH
jgi:hypothetical protein